MLVPVVPDLYSLNTEPLGQEVFPCVVPIRGGYIYPPWERRRERLPEPPIGFRSNILEDQSVSEIPRGNSAGRQDGGETPRRGNLFSLYGRFGDRAVSREVQQVSSVRGAHRATTGYMPTDRSGDGRPPDKPRHEVSISNHQNR